MDRPDGKTFIELSGAECVVNGRSVMEILKTRWGLKRRQRGRKRHRK